MPRWFVQVSYVQNSPQGGRHWGGGGGEGYPIPQYREKIGKYRDWWVQPSKTPVIGWSWMFLPISSCQKLCNHLPFYKDIDLHQQESPNEQYHNTVRDLLLPNTINQKDEKPHTTGLDDTAISNAHLNKNNRNTLLWKKQLNTVNPHVALFKSHLFYCFSII